MPKHCFSSKSLLRRTISPIWLLLASAFVYIPGLFTGFAFQAGDDNWMVYNNPYIKDLSYDSIEKIFTTFYSGQYSPLNTLVYAIVFNFADLNPFWFHLVSLLAHMLNITLVFKFVRKLLSVSGTHSFQDVFAIAFITALLFAIHPMQVESVIWISASKIPFYSIFFLVTLINYINFVDTVRGRYYVRALLLFVISFCFKEQAVILPAILFLLRVYLKGNINEAKFWIELAPFVALSIIFGIVTLQAQQSGFATKLETDYYPLHQRIILASFNFSEYVFKLLMPLNLSFSYGFPMKPGEPLPTLLFFYPIVVAGIISFFFIVYKSGKFIYFFGFAFFSFSIFLSLHILPMARSVLIADRYVYIGSIGIFLILSTFIRYLIVNSTPCHRTAYIILSSAYLFYLGFYTWTYSAHWI